MDKPIIAYDRFDGGRRQVHRIVGTVPPELAAFGLAKGSITTPTPGRAGNFTRASW